MDFKQAILERLASLRGQGGVNDPRSLAGNLSRGRNVYNGGTNAAVRGPQGPGFGRPKTNKLQEAARARLGG